MFPTGSSPLARGLLLPGRHTVPCVGIIPARAGFTRTSRACACPTGDHPRSRGVYRRRSRRSRARQGSSPLARGLLGTTFHYFLSARIIPARAGFTRRRARRRRPAGDHPRSRGVYADDDGRVQITVGSSPLARGLPVSGSAMSAVVGIIPARAGFTPLPPGRRSRGRDHPRSRGVYALNTKDTIIAQGSSPLARGLQPGREHHGPAGGIIPARAGFTASHPRPLWLW